VTKQTAAQETGYRRVYISHPSGVTVSGKVTDANGNTAATFENSRMTSSNDPWIGITTCDSGDWLRLPMENKYKVTITTKKTCRISLKLTEYSIYDDREVRSVMRDEKNLWSDIDMNKNRTLTLTVPKIESNGGEYHIGSDVYYYTSIKDKIVTKLTVNKTSVSMRKGKTFRIKAKVINTMTGKKIAAQTKKIKYSSSSKKVATVSSKGVIKAKKKGTCYITVKAPDGKKRKIKVKVSN
jgi:uncharacterized protein YjdB